MTGSPSPQADGDTTGAVETRRTETPVTARREARLSRDLAACCVNAVLFSLALGAASVALPLLALDNGYTSAQVGVLTAVSAITQMVSRLGMGAVMRRVGDWALVVAGQLLLALSSGLVALSAAWVPFVVAELLQGAARGLNWTGSQTHITRSASTSMSGMATINFFSSVGLLAGPIVAGVVGAHRPAAAMAVAAGMSVVGLVPALLLDRYPAFARVRARGERALWRRPGVDVGCWAGVTAGAWRGLLGSYVPVVLAHARQSSRTIGVLVSTANGASIVGSLLVARLRTSGARVPFVVGTLGAALGTALVGVLSGSAVLAAAVLAVSGLGAGALQTLGPAIATDAVRPDERGEAIAIAGAFRAGALFAAPLLVAGLLSITTVAGGLIVIGALMGGSPMLSARRVGRHPQ